VQRTSRAKRKRCLAPRFPIHASKAACEPLSSRVPTEPLPSCPRFVGGRRRGEYRTRSIARSPARTIVTCPIPRRGCPVLPPEGWGVDRPALPADSVPPVEHRVAGADLGAPSGCVVSERTQMSSKTPRGSAASSTVFFLEKILVVSGVTARSRAASPTKRGQNCIASQAIIEDLHFEKGTSQPYPRRAPSWRGSRTIGRLRCSIARGTCIRGCSHKSPSRVRFPANRTTYAAASISQIDPFETSAGP
jgi:hypothetical protein